MKRKYLFIITTIVSILVLVYVGIGLTYSKFTAKSDTVLSGNFKAKLDYTVYFQAPPGWINKNTNVMQVYAYMWNDEGTKNANYPGVLIDEYEVSGLSDIYKCNIPVDAGYTHISFSNGASDKVTYYDDNEEKVFGSRTIDLDLTNDSGTVNQKIFVPEIYDSSTSVRSIAYLFEPECHLHLWGNQSNGWPGESQENVTGNAYKSIINKNDYLYMIYNEGSGTGRYQSPNMNVPQKQDLTCIFRKNMPAKDYYGNAKANTYHCMWRRLFYFGSWYSMDEWVNNTGGLRVNWENGDYVTFNNTKDDAIVYYSRDIVK